MTLLETRRRQAAGDGDDLVRGPRAAHRRRRRGEEELDPREREVLRDAIALLDRIAAH